MDTSQDKVIPKSIFSGAELVYAQKSEQVFDKTDMATRDFVRLGGDNKIMSTDVLYDHILFDEIQPEEFKTKIVEVVSEDGEINALNIFSLVQMSSQKGDVMLRGEADFLGNDHMIFRDEVVKVNAGDRIQIEISYKGGDKPENATIEIINLGPETGETI